MTAQTKTINATVIANDGDYSLHEPNLEKFVKWITERHARCGGITEIRIHDGQRIYAGFFDVDHQQDLLDQIKPIKRKRIPYGEHPRIGEANVYFTMQPVHPDLLARKANRIDYAKSGELTSDEDIVAYCFFAVDIDPERRAGISATTEEKRRACKVKDQVAGWFDARSIAYMQADSGNGYHLDIPTIIYNGDSVAATTAKAKALLTLLDETFSTEHASIDTKIYNASRILKLYGTKAVKGDHTEARPHRLSDIDMTNIPDDIDLFERLAAEIEPFMEKTSEASIKATSTTTTQRSSGGNGWSRDEAVRVLEGVLKAGGFKVKRQPKGGQELFRFERCPVHTDDDGHTFECAVMVKPNGQYAGSCKHTDATWKGDFRNAIGWDDHVGPVMERLGLRAKTSKNGEGDGCEPTVNFVCLKDVTRTELSFVWPHRIARRKLNVWGGDADVGKSLINTTMAATVTAGRQWPEARMAPTPEDAAMYQARPGNVILLSAEDDIADTIGPRFDAAQGDSSKLFILESVTDKRGVRGFSLKTDLERLREMIEEIGGAELVILDPLSAYLGNNTDSYRDSDIRGILAPFNALAQKYDFAGVYVGHLNKSKGQSYKYRLSGGVAFFAAARLAWYVVEDDENEDDSVRRGLILPGKANILPKDKTSGLAYTIESSPINGAPVLRFDDTPPALTAKDALENDDSQHEKSEAVKWLRDKFKTTWTGPIARDDVYREGKAAGHGSRILRYAKKKLGGAHKQLGAGKDKVSLWAPPGFNFESYGHEGLEAIAAEARGGRGDG